MTTHPIPKTARYAFALLQDENRRKVTELTQLTVSDAGLTGKWRVDFEAGVMVCLDPSTADSEPSSTPPSA